MDKDIVILLVIDLFAGVSGMNGATLSIITGSVLATLAVTAWMLRRCFRQIPSVRESILGGSALLSAARHTRGINTNKTAFYCL